MKVLLFSGIAFVLLCGVAYAEPTLDCPAPIDLSDFVTVVDKNPDAGPMALCDGCPCCAPIKQTRGGCRCVGGDQCKRCCIITLYSNSGQDPPPSCRCHYRRVRTVERCGKHASCYPCDVGDVATIPEIFEERGG